MTSEPRYPFVHVDVASSEVDEVSALLFELGAQGVEERDETTLAKNASAGRVTLVAAFATPVEAEEAIGQIPSELLPRYEEVVGDAWRDAWKEHYKPYVLAEGIVVRPPWEPYDANPGEVVLELEPGRAFGTGLHETTRLVARALKAHANELAGKPILDVGCGSGILALVALLCGASNAVATDIDPDAVAVTVENATRNGMTNRVEATTQDLSEIDFVAPVVVANIEARVLIPMARELTRHVAPGGLLLLSGILVPQKDDVRAAYPAMTLIEAPDLGEWTLLALRAPDAPR
ncbi:MAG: 50S ribosomal protein L11 methyltransferase [Deltaproteobacteria bacterium]|nr:50S ribosomal protein L11 methyltransferase [Deltaproteobacteria bacterium]